MSARPASDAVASAASPSSHSVLRPVAFSFLAALILVFTLGALPRRMLAQVSTQLARERTAIVLAAFAMLVSVGIVLLVTNGV